MREILFRAKQINNCKWRYGLIARIGENDVSNIIDTETEILVPVSTDTIGQYTGLTDKNGQKIFEGDVVKTHYANAKKADFIEQVVFYNGRFVAFIKIGTCKHWANLFDGTKHLTQDKSVYMDCVEVIGNIYDNPELIEMERIEDNE